MKKKKEIIVEDNRSVQEKIEQDYYSTKLLYPENNYHICLRCKKFVREAKFCSYCGEPHDYKALHEIYRKKKAAYTADERKRLELFKRDAIKEVGLEGHPKAKAVWEKSWEYGCNNGLSNVLYYLDDLADLVL